MRVLRTSASALQRPARQHNSADTADEPATFHPKPAQLPLTTVTRHCHLPLPATATAAKCWFEHDTYNMAKVLLAFFDCKVINSHWSVSRQPMHKWVDQQLIDTRSLIERHSTKQASAQ